MRARLCLLLLLLPTMALAEPLSLRLAVYTPESGNIKMTLRVENMTDQVVDVTQSDGQTHDFVVADAQGKTVWKWSENRFFLQAISELTLGPGEIQAFQGEWNGCSADGKPLPEGSYKVWALIPRHRAEPLKTQPRHLQLRR